MRLFLKTPIILVFVNSDFSLRSTELNTYQKGFTMNKVSTVIISMA
jgi:hypothetical protein